MAGCLAAQTQHPASGGTIVVIPFENRSSAPGLEWIGESFPELLGQQLSSPSYFVVPREDRLHAYDRAGIPAGLHPSRATLYRMAEDMGADYVVLGYYDFDGRNFTASAQLLNMQVPKLMPEVHESGPLIELMDIQTALAWDLLQTLRPDSAIRRQAFLDSAPSIRLDAFENYIRGIIAASAVERINRFREAVRISPGYTRALLALGKTCFEARQYDQAILALAQVSETDPAAREANFYLGLAAYYRGDYDRASAAFGFVAARLPLTEVYNNLGVVTARRGKKNAAEYFQKASDSDPGDPDYHFNLAIAECRAGDAQGALRQLRETLSLHPSDAEAQLLLDHISAGGTIRLQASKLPLERIRSNYNESPFRQLSMQISAVAEQRLSQADPKIHAQFHTDRGRELLAQGFISEAEKDLREAIGLDPANAEAHAGLARVLEADNDPAGARFEAEAALRLKSFAEPLVVLADLDLRENKEDDAAQSVDQALRLEPASAPALALKRAIAAKLAEKAQPLPKR